MSKAAHLAQKEKGMSVMSEIYKNMFTIFIPIASAIWATITAISNQVDRIKLKRPRKLLAVRIQTKHEGGVEDLDERNCSSISLYFDRLEIQRKKTSDAFNHTHELWISVECIPTARMVSYRAQPEQIHENWLEKLMLGIGKILCINK